MDTETSSKMVLPSWQFVEVVCPSDLQPKIVDSPATPVPIDPERGLSFRKQLQSFATLPTTQNRGSQTYLFDLLQHVLTQCPDTSPFSDLRKASTTDTRSIQLHTQNLNTTRGTLGLPTPATTAYLLFCEEYRRDHPNTTQPTVNAAWKAYRDDAQTEADDRFEAEAAQQRTEYLTRLEAWQKAHHSKDSAAPWLRLPTVTTTVIPNQPNPTPAPTPAEEAPPLPDLPDHLLQQLTQDPNQYLQIQTAIQHILRQKERLPPIFAGPAPNLPPRGRGQVTQRQQQEAAPSPTEGRVDE